MDAPTAFLRQLATRSTATWQSRGRRVFPGEASLETGNSLYRFRDGVFISRARKPARSFDAPKSMRGMRLIGFLTEEAGRLSLSPRWRAGAHAVLWRPGTLDDSSFVVTSPVGSMAIEEPPMLPRAERIEPSHSGIQLKVIARAARPPKIARPCPASMTRLHPAKPLEPPTYALT
ncbi:MAG: hypothetical protein KF819_27225 [Labilithrix sp.]|nr:hypothetical protein [Labilithrix sp.]